MKRSALGRMVIIMLAAALVPACGSGGGGAALGGSGSLDPGFGDGGAVEFANRISNAGAPTSVAVDATSVYVAGTDTLLSNDTIWHLEKRSLSDGSPDVIFGAGTGVSASAPASFSTLLCMAIDSTSMYLAGSQLTAGTYAWRIEKRSLVSGLFDGSFGGSSGFVTSIVNANTSFPTAIAVDGTAVYIAGLYNPTPGDEAWRIEKRLITDGSLVATFGSGGVLTENPSTANDVPRGMVVDSSFMYVVGNSGTSAQWRIEKRQLSDGSLVAGFGTAGVVLGNAGAATSLAIDSTSMYVVGHETLPPSDVQWRIEKRLLADGSAVAGFGTAGVVTSNPTAGGDVPGAIAIDGTFLYVVGSEALTQETQWRIEKRLLTSGAPDPSFGDGTAALSAITNQSPGATGIALTSTALFVVGTDMVHPGDPGLHWRIEKRLK